MGEGCHVFRYVPLSHRYFHVCLCVVVAFSDVCRLQIGQATPVFSRFRKQRTRELKQRSFSLIYGKERSLDLVCFSKEDFLLWVRALRFLISRRFVVPSRVIMQYNTFMFCAMKTPVYP